MLYVYGKMNFYLLKEIPESERFRQPSHEQEQNNAFRNFVTFV